MIAEKEKGRTVAADSDPEENTLQDHFTWSYAPSKYDAWPVNSDGSLRAFYSFCNANRSPIKGKGHIVAAMAGNGRRCAANALPRNWLAIDADGIDSDVFLDWRMYLSRFQGFGWPTASSAPEAPRERVIVTLDEPATREQCIGIGALLMRDIGEVFGAAVRIDPCTFRPEQPCYLPVGDVQLFALLGDPIDTAAWLAQAPAPKAPPKPLDEFEAEIADARMRYLVGLLGDAGMLTAALFNGRGYAMRCPWEADHTEADAPGSTATALLFPAEANGHRGAFRCLHAHCAGRGIADLEQIVRSALSAREAA